MKPGISRTFPIKHYNLEIGFHSFKDAPFKSEIGQWCTLSDHGTRIPIMYTGICQHLFHATIPKGATYALDDRGCYISDQLIINNIIQNQ